MNFNDRPIPQGATVAPLLMSQMHGLSHTGAYAGDILCSRRLGIRVVAISVPIDFVVSEFSSPSAHLSNALNFNSARHAVVRNAGHFARSRRPWKRVNSGARGSLPYDERAAQGFYAMRGRN